MPLGGAVPQAIVDDATGGLVVTGFSFDAATGIGTVDYSYTLKDNTLAHGPGNNGENNFSIGFPVVVTDADGSNANASLDVTIVDDVPTAVADVDSVTEDGPLVANGNVLTAAAVATPDANLTDGVADVQGADGATVTAVPRGEAGTVGGDTAGAHGTLVLAAGGSYTYTLNNADPLVQALAAGQTLQDVFSYTITDGDGDVSTTTLTITIEGANDGVTITAWMWRVASWWSTRTILRRRAGPASRPVRIPRRTA